MLKPYAALAAIPVLFILCPAPAQATELLIEPVFSSFNPATDPDAGPNSVTVGFYNPGIATRLDTNSPLGNIIYPQTIPSDPTLIADGDPSTFLITFQNNTNYTLTSFTLEIVGMADAADDDDGFTDDDVIPASADDEAYPGVTYAEVRFGDVGMDGYLGDIFPDDPLISADGHMITFSGVSIPVGAIFTDYALMSLGGTLLTEEYAGPRLAFKASFEGVPEPATAGLMLAGLAGVGLAVGRRRRQPAAAC